MQKKVKYSHSSGVIKKCQGTAIPRHTQNNTCFDYTKRKGIIQELWLAGYSGAEIYNILCTGIYE